MDLGLTGTKVVSQSIEYTYGIRLSDGYFVRIESPFFLEPVDGGERTALDPESSERIGFEPLDGLLGLEVAESTVDADGRLTLKFSDGQRLVAEPDPSFEAWTVAGPDGYLVVCAAGGELSIWEKTSEN